MNSRSGSKAVANPQDTPSLGLLTDRLLGLPRTAKQALAVLLDIALCVLALWAAFALRLETFYPPMQAIPLAAAIGVAVAIPILASVTDENAMGKVFGHFSPQTVFHAAAYKHVPMVERNIGAAVWNNVWGILAVTAAGLVTTHLSSWTPNAFKR